MSVAGSIWATRLPLTRAHTKPPPQAMSPPPIGPVSAVTVATRAFVAGSTCDTDPSLWFSVNTPVSPTVRNRGPAPTRMVASTFPERGSRRTSVPFGKFVIHSEPNPARTAVDPGGTAKVPATLSVSGFTGTIVVPSADNAHTPSEPAPTDDRGRGRARRQHRDEDAARGGSHQAATRRAGAAALDHIGRVVGHHPESVGGRWVAAGMLAR